jgi:hypothetical protein
MSLKVSSKSSIMFNLTRSTILKWWMFELLRWILNLHQSTWDHYFFYADRYSKDEKLVLTLFV